jgi:PAS domain S-box-containing protein
MRRWLAALLFAWWLPAAGAQPQQPALVLGDEPSYVLSRAFQYLEDPGGMLSFDEVVTPAVQARFRPLAPLGPGPNFGLTRSAFWLKVTLEVPPGAQPDWYLEVAYPPLDQVAVYSPDTAFGYVRQAGGDSEPYSAREVPHRNHVFPVHLPPASPATLYLRVQSEGTVSAPVRLWQPKALWAQDQRAYAALALYFGLLLGLLAYNLLLWVSVQDRAYLYYVAFAASMGVGQAALSGLGTQFLWPEWTWWAGVSVPVGLTTTAIFGLMFARTFLSSAARMPVLDKVLLAQAGGWGLSLLAALALPYAVSAWMVTVLAVVSVATMAVVGYISIRREFAGARWFFTAWAMLLLGVGLLSLHNTGVLPSNAVTSNALLLGSALEMVLLSFALGDRINVARRFKEQAQARIAAEHAMVEALSESQARLKQVLEEREVILENSIVGIAFLTPSGRFKWANKAMLDIFGAGRSPITTMEPFYLSREQYLQVGGEVAAAVARGDVYERELQVQQFDGTRIWIQLSGKAVSRTDLSQGTVWVIMDITERKQLEEQLRHTMSEREAILNNAVVGIVLSVNRRHEWVNEKFAQMLGYPRQILIGQSSMYIHPDEASWLRFGEEARAALEATNAYTCERQLKRRNGELFWVEMGGSCVRPHDPDSGVIWTFLDITERKKSEDEVREALEQQKALNELRTRFVAMTSHEFRTPLAAILSAEEVLRHYGDRLPQSERLATLDDIAAGVQRMSRMMDRILLLGQADAKMLDFTPAPLDLPALCRKLVEEARAQHPGTRCQVVARWGAGVGRGLYDEKLLRHIFGNLLSNALKYSPAGGEVALSVRREEGETVFEVRDQGIGIPPEEVGHLFESFHRASNVGAIPGTGLGLAIVKNAVEVHGGRIEVASELGRGTCFTVRLPVQAEAPGQVSG